MYDLRNNFIFKCYLCILQFNLFQIHLALYCYANNQITTALKLLYRARYLAVMICGENHPEIALLDVCTQPFFIYDK